MAWEKRKIKGSILKHLGHGMIIDVSIGIPKKLGDAAVVIDVFRSSTTIVTALDNGAKYIIPTKTVIEARRLKSRLSRRESVLLAGERMGITPRGFDMNISPQLMRREIVDGKVLIYTSTNLTRALLSCKSAKHIIIGGLTNAKAVAEYLDKLNPRHVTLVACGLVVKKEVNMEDVIGAGAIIDKLQSETKLTDLAMLALLAYQNPRWRKFVKEGMIAGYLGKLGFSEDIKYCLRENTSQTVPILVKDKIIPAEKSG